MNERKKVTKYEYEEKSGETVYFKERTEPGPNGSKKDFIVKRVVNGKELIGRGHDPIPYNLPELLKCKYAFIVEGENKVEELRKLGLVATCLDSGAKSPWLKEYNQYFKHLKKAVLLPDNDAAGQGYASTVAQSLENYVSKIKIVNLPDLPEKGDIVDWVKLKLATPLEDVKKELLDLVEEAPLWVSEPKRKLFASLESWDFIKEQEEKVEWAVDKIIPKQSITVIFGRGGIGKTWLALQISQAIGSGRPFLGHTTIKLPVVYIDFENPLSVLIERTQSMGDGGGVCFWRANKEDNKAPKLDQSDWAQYKLLPRESVLVFDTLRAAHSKDENSSEFMSNIMGKLKELRDMGFTIILLHHTAKNVQSTGKGSTAIRDLSDGQKHCRFRY